MVIRGKLIRKTFAAESKSAHEAVYIQTEDGDYVIRLKRSNPFENKELQALIGKEVIAEGELIDYLFTAQSIKVV
jgi:hypothetical protein